MSSWDDTNSNIIFSAPGGGGKKAKLMADGDDGMVTSFSNIDSQFGSSLDMPGMDDYLQLQQDSVACRVRAKRGCATHPRSIAERERRTRISKRLRRLQDLVPNMDKQTNTSDMLDIAVDYIKVLQDQIESEREMIEETKTGPRKLLLLSRSEVLTPQNQMCEINSGLDNCISVCREAKSEDCSSLCLSFVCQRIRFRHRQASRQIKELQRLAPSSSITTLHVVLILVHFLEASAQNW
uniref:Transcription factor bHLH128 n=1 Tax=Aegilops tauschii TaxID=37682 RepID=M8C0E2_AEGTA